MSVLSMSMRSLGQTAVHGSQGISWTQWRTGKTPLSSPGIRSCTVGSGLGLQDLGRPVPVRGDLADVMAERPGHLEAPDLAREDGRRGFGDLLGVAGGEDGEPEFAGFVVELVDRIEADGDEQRVAGERPLGSRDRPELLSTRAIVTDSTASAPLALTTVCDV